MRCYFQGGYLHHVYQYAAQELAGKQVDEVEVIRKRDFLEANLVTADGKTLKFAIVSDTEQLWRLAKEAAALSRLTLPPASLSPPPLSTKANGFKCIQNIMRKIKRGKCPYDYIEIMACPKGGARP